MAPDNDILSFIKDWLWAPLLGLIGWAWSRNEKAHDMLWSKHDAIREDASKGHSLLNDRLMEHIDAQVADVKDQNRRQSDKFADHITKLFENAEKDRQRYNEQFSTMQRDIADKHAKLVEAIYNRGDK